MMTWLSSPKERKLLSPAVTSGDYFFLELKPRTDGPVAVAFGGRELCHENYSVQRTTFPFSTLEYVAEGSGQLSIGRSRLQPLQAGSVFAYGPGVRIDMKTLHGSTMVKYFICLTGRGCRAAVARRAPFFGRTAMLVHHGSLRDLFDLLIREGTEHTPLTRDMCSHIFELILLKISEGRRIHEKRPNLTREKFFKCKTLIDEEAGRLGSLRDVADALHIETSGLNRLFRRYQGVSPYKYLLHRKMNLAAQDLITNGGFIKEVASRSGYFDQYHFSRVFKSVHGISPAIFLRHYAKSS